MQIKITTNQIIMVVTMVAVAVFGVYLDHSIQSEKAKDRALREQGQARELAVFKKLEASMEKSRSNTQNYAAIQDQLKDVKTSFISLELSINALNTKVIEMTQDYLKKTEFQNSLDKLETNTRNSILRQGEVLYNDKRQLQAGVTRNLMATENNAKDIQFIKGRVLIPTDPQRASNSGTLRHEKVTLSR